MSAWPMSAWETWCALNLDRDRRLIGFPHWRAVGVWELERDDGVMSGHKVESPYPDWQTTMEESVQLYDKVLLLHQRDKWPRHKAIRDGGDINFGLLLAEHERGKL